VSRRDPQLLGRCMAVPRLKHGNSDQAGQRPCGDLDEAANGHHERCGDQSNAGSALAVAECIRAKVFRAEDPMHIAGVLWAATHGAVSLELAGYEGAVEAEHRFDDLCAAAAAWFMTPERSSAEYSGPRS